eukprot:SAG11_NODE_339_length_10506_cov_12.368588_7_plen_88_part_00
MGGYGKGGGGYGKGYSMGYGGGGYGGGGGGYGGGGGGGDKTVLQVPDNMIGAIVGRGGVTINEIMSSTGARMQISQKGEYYMGTRNR